MTITLYVFYTSIWSKTRPNLYYGNQTIWSQIKYILYRHITNLNRFVGAVVAYAIYAEVSGSIP